MTDTRTPNPASDGARKAWDLAMVKWLRHPKLRPDDEAAAAIIQQYGDQRETAGKVVSEKMARAYEAAGFRRGVEDAAKVAYRTCAETRHVALGSQCESQILTLLETQEAG